MGQVLVIKNADFATNRVAVITFDGKPCTGIELAESSITVFGTQPVTVEYTVTPSDTTDTVTWSSSDTSVATVSGSVVTIVGIGSTTITAVCGGYSDSLTLTVSAYEQPDWYLSSSLSVGEDSNHNKTVSSKLSPSSNAYSRIVAARSSQKTSFPYRIMDSTDYTADNGVRPIKIPNGVGSINIVVEDGLANTSSSNVGLRVIFTSGNESILFNDTYTYVKAIDDEVITVSNKSASGTVSVPEGADSYILGSRLYDNVASDANPATVASNCNFTIQYVQASV